MTAPSLGAGLVNPCRKREGKADCFEPNEAARPLPARILRFPHLRRRGRPTSARVADQTVELDWRQAMPRAEPALSRAPRHLSAVIGAAITTGVATPVTPSGPPPQSGGLTPEGCPARKRGQGVLPTPLTPSGPPPSGGHTPEGCPGDGQGALGAGGCAGTTTLRLPWESPGAFLVLLHAHCHDAAHGEWCE